MKYGVVRGGTIVHWLIWDGVSPHPYEGDELVLLPNNAQPRLFMGRPVDEVVKPRPLEAEQQ